MKVFFYLFKLIPSSYLTFISGIFVATGVNMITSSLPESIVTNNLINLILALLFWLLAAIMTRWALAIDLFIRHNEEDMKSVASNYQGGDKKLWYDFIHEPRNKGVKNTLLRCFWGCLLVGSIIICIILFPICPSSNNTLDRLNDEICTSTTLDN